MKKITVLCFAFLLGAGTAIAQKITADKVPSAISSAFSAKFADANKVKWEMEDGGYEAKFKLNGSKMSAVFDQNGQWLETETDIKVSALPAAVLATLNKDFTGYEVEEACKVESGQHGNVFEVEVEKGEAEFEVLLSAEGKVIRQAKEEEED